MKKLLLVIIMLGIAGVSFGKSVLSHESGKNISYYESFFEKSSPEIKSEIEKVEKSDDLEKDFKLGILYNALATKGLDEKKASKNAEDHMEKALKKDGKNSRVNVYYAMALSLVGRDHWNPIIQMMAVKKSFKYFDKAVELAEQNSANDVWYIRLMRSNVYLSLPDFFDKARDGLEDLEYIKEVYETETEDVPHWTAIQAYYHLGEFSKTDGNIEQAIEYWEKAVEISEENSVHTEQVKKAKKQLDIFIVE